MTISEIKAEIQRLEALLLEKQRESKLERAELEVGSFVNAYMDNYDVLAGRIETIDGDFAWIRRAIALSKVPLRCCVNIPERRHTPAFWEKSEEQ